MLQKDLVLDGVAEVTFEPDERVLQEIYQKIRELDLASIDRETPEYRGMPEANGGYD